MKKPNVLFILTDDQRFNTIHALGNPDIITPNLDRLVNMGTTFTQAHIPGGTSGAVCMPSRAMINSSKLLFHLNGAGESIPKDDCTMGQCFRENGYRTIGIGKWHNGIESYQRSFSDGDEIFFGGMWDHWNVPVNSYHADGVYDHIIRVTPNFTACNHPMKTVAERVTAGVHSTELFTDAAVRFLQEKHEEPFFMYLAMLAPHDPRTMPEKYREMYDPEKLTLPENFCAEHPFFYGVDLKTNEARDENLAAHPRSEQEVRNHLADYYAMISHIDDHVGRLLDTLEETGQLENTIIVFTGDNGLAVGCHGLMGKQSLYEHSVRVPLIFAGPGIPQNCRRDARLYLLDLFPTLCGLCGLPVPESAEGCDFSASVTQGEDGREVLYLAYTDLIRGVKDDRYKLVLYRMCPENNQLFDLQEDPAETVNHYHDPAFSEHRARLERLLQEQRAIWEDRTDNGYSYRFWEGGADSGHIG